MQASLMPMETFSKFLAKHRLGVYTLSNGGNKGLVMCDNNSVPPQPKCQPRGLIQAGDTCGSSVDEQNLFGIILSSAEMSYLAAITFDPSINAMNYHTAEIALAREKMSS